MPGRQAAVAPGRGVRLVLDRGPRIAACAGYTDTFPKPE